LFFYDFCPYLGLNQDQLLNGQHAFFDWGCGSNGEGSNGEESNGEEEEKTVILTSFPLRLENGNVSSLRRMSISWVVEKVEQADRDEKYEVFWTKQLIKGLWQVFDPSGWATQPFVA
jgi:hypothetical protein